MRHSMRGNAEKRGFPKDAVIYVWGMLRIREVVLGLCLVLPLLADASSRGIVAYEHVCRPGGLIVIAEDGFVALVHLSGENFEEGDFIRGDFLAHGIGRFFRQDGANGYFRLLGWRQELESAMRLLCE